MVTIERPACIASVLTEYVRHHKRTLDTQLTSHIDDKKSPEISIFISIKKNIIDMHVGIKLHMIKNVIRKLH